MDTVRRLRRIIKSMALAVVALAIIGYLFAKSSLSACERDAYREMAIKNVHGREFGGRAVPLSEIKLSSRVICPFVVSVEFSVPRGLHKSFHERRYVTLPWGNYRILADDVYLVFRIEQNARLVANNSFKPNPLRGSA